MKTKILIVAFTLMTGSVLKAQMRISNTADDYIKCINTCKDNLPAGDDLNTCKTLCAKCPKVSFKVLSTSQDLTPQITTFVTKGSSKHLIYSDGSYQYFVVYTTGKVAGYQIKSMEDGTEVAFPVATFIVSGIKSYYIFDANGKYLKVKKPDVTPIFEIAAQANP